MTTPTAEPCACDDDRTPREMGPMLLAPCARPGGDGDWWQEQHAFCTGSHHVGPGPENEVLCSCECHTTRPEIRPEPLTAEELAEQRRKHRSLPTMDPTVRRCGGCEGWYVDEYGKLADDQAYIDHDDSLWPCEPARLLATLHAAQSVPPSEGLDTAWAEAQAALPPGHSLTVIIESWDDRTRTGHYGMHKTRDGAVAGLRAAAAFIARSRALSEPPSKPEKPR